MPVPSFSRHSRPLSPPTPATSAIFRPTRQPTASPAPSASSYSHTATAGQQKLNVVTRVAIEGKAKRDQDGASVKVYLKISLPLDSVTPGSTIPLFPEENVKILTSQVHPIDNNSVPYNFSSSLHPLLHGAARALNLPARSSQSYQSVFGLSPPPTTASIPSSRRSASSSKTTGSSAEPAPLDIKYTGHILVSGYNISYVLPKEFPPRVPENGVERDDYNHNGTSSRGRRHSIVDRNVVQFMAAIDMWVPYVSRPPRSPYLLSIPTPRCLHNNMKLRIFSPASTSSSYASLSSADDESGGSWDLASEPHVTRSASNRLSRASSYTHFADDESSDSSTTGFSEGCGIQGTFPSAERIHIRWAKPMKLIGANDRGDGRRRVGVKDVKGEMSCTVVGKVQNKNGPDGVIMNVEYKGICKGVWFAGVATLLGMDVGLEAKGSDVSWAPGIEPKWTVNGGLGYTGWDVGSPLTTLSRQSSTDSTGQPQHFLLSTNGTTKPEFSAPSTQLSSTVSSTSSLLRAPLPAQSVTEYSFEGSSSSSPSGTLLSSITSLPTSSDPHLPSPLSDGKDLGRRGGRPPAVPITLHINMNELGPPSQNIFTFNISGTIVVTPRGIAARSRPKSVVLNSPNSSPIYSDDESESDPIVLPRFTVLAADSESTHITVRNDVDSGNVNIEVFNSSGDIRDAQVRKTVLQKGGSTKCGEDGGRIALRALRTPTSHFRSLDSSELQPSSRPRTPNGLPRVASSTSLRQTLLPSMRPQRDGPLMIPSVETTVTPLIDVDQIFSKAYTVRVCLPVPADADSEWLEFGLAQAGPGVSTALLFKDGGSGPPRVEIASASVEGVPVRFETTATAKQEQDGQLGTVPFEELSGREWVSWVRVHVGTGRGTVVVDYVVRDRNIEPDKKGKARGDAHLNVLLPTFALPVGRLEVNIAAIDGLDVTSLQSNLAYQQTLHHSRQLLHFTAEELFYPRLVLSFHPTIPLRAHAPRRALAHPLRLLASVVPFALFCVLFVSLLSLGAEMRQMRHALDSYSVLLGTRSGWSDPLQTVTVTATVLAAAPTTRQLDVPHSSALYSAPADTTTLAAPPSPLLPPPPPSAPLPPSRPPRPPTTVLAKSSATDNYALLDIRQLPFSWPLRFDFEVPPAARLALDKVLDGLGSVWQVLRKVYHYPLDPP